MRTTLVAVGLLFLGMFFGIAVSVRLADAAPPAGDQLDSKTFNLLPAKFDAQLAPKAGSPRFPKSWKLIAVSEGEERGMSLLWFEDANGARYRVTAKNNGVSLEINPFVVQID